MVHIDNIHPLTDFKRNTGEFRERLRRTGLPALLTVEGRPELIVQDAQAYQRMLDLIERLEAVEGISAGLESMRSGKGSESSEFFRQLKKQIGVPGKSGK